MNGPLTSPTAIRITLDLWPLLAGLVLVPLTVVAAVAALRKTPPTLSRDLLHRFGIGALPPGLVVALGLLWCMLFATFTLGILWVIVALLWRGPALSPDLAPDYRWHLLTLTALTAALGAVVALPFTLLRTGYAARQTRTAEENLTTDLINKAVEGLGAQKEVNQLGRTFAYTVGDRRHTVFETVDNRTYPPDGASGIDYNDWQNVALTVPNIEVRLGAIYALERIAQDSPRDHVRVMEILCAYLRENAPARSARRHDLGPWPDYPRNPTNDDLRARKAALEERRKAVARCIADLRENHAPRADIQAAVTVIGRRRPAQIALERATDATGTPAYRLDLRKVNLQAADLSELNLSHARLDGAHLDGADFKAANLESAVLTHALMAGILLVGGNVTWTSLGGTNLEVADLRDATWDGAHLAEAQLHAAELDGASLADANLSGARLENARLVGAHLENANLVGAHLEGAELQEAHLDGANFSGAHLEGTDLSDAHLAGTALRGARLSDGTYFSPATLRGACLRDLNLSVAETDDDALSQRLAEAFGDASVILPEGLKAGAPPLAHWSTRTLDRGDFNAAWRAHQRAIGYVPRD